MYLRDITKLPELLLVKIDSYTGPLFIPGLETQRMISLTAVTATFLYKSHICSRKQLLISLAWAITAHKSQDLTLDSAVIELGTNLKEMVNGITFVAISHVRRINDLFQVFHLVNWIIFEKEKT
jgi:hypothetical protein